MECENGSEKPIDKMDEVFKSVLETATRETENITPPVWTSNNWSEMPIFYFRQPNVHCRHHSQNVPIPPITGHPPLSLRRPRHLLPLPTLRLALCLCRQSLNNSTKLRCQPQWPLSRIHKLLSAALRWLQTELWKSSRSKEGPLKCHFLRYKIRMWKATENACREKKSWSRFSMLFYSFPIA